MDTTLAWQRYERARTTALRALLLHAHNGDKAEGQLSRAEDALDALETALLWRTIAEGGTVSAATMEQLLEATSS